MIEFVLGATAMGCVVASLFFARFWRETGDRFFALFALAFVTFGVNRFVIVVLGGREGDDTAAYVIRLIAFIIIVAAIVDKNRGPRRPRASRSARGSAGMKDRADP
jgi:Fe2+ transport system protein B